MAGQRNTYGKRTNSQSDYSDNGGNKRRNPGDDRDQFVIDSEDTVYRYLCPVRKIGSVIGRGGEIVKQLRADTKSKIRIGETVPGCEERVVTIYSSSDETNALEDSGNYVCPAQDALYKVHDRVVAEDLHGDEESDGGHQVTARLLVPSDQIGCVIGKGGQIVQNIRGETGAQIRILKDEHLPPCALNSDELVQVIWMNCAQTFLILFEFVHYTLIPVLLLLDFFWSSNYKFHSCRKCNYIFTESISLLFRNLHFGEYEAYRTYCWTDLQSYLFVWS